MDGGRYDDFTLAQARSVEPSNAGRKPKRRPRPAIGKVENAPPRPMPKAFHYATERTMMLGQLVDMLPPGPTLALSANARRLPVVGVRLTSRSGAAVHAAPALTGNSLFVDHRDLAALDAGALVPDLAAVVERAR